MRVARTLEELAQARAELDGVASDPEHAGEQGQAARADASSAPDAVGFVPTMGALHEGHLSLVRAARRDCRAVAASIFVNPTQFAPGEDLARYPRDEDGDLAKLREAGCALVWLPSPAIMYPPGDATEIVPSGPALHWEGAQRPGHFRGVATVVAKLLGQIRPQRAYFGEKDWQQLQVIRRMAHDLYLPVRIVAVPTWREPDGLAMSSRNRFLTDAQREVAPRLAEALRDAARRLAGETAASRMGIDPVGTLLSGVREGLAQAGFLVDYLALVEARSLRETSDLRGEFPDGARLVAAARLGSVRLLDTISVPLPL